MIEITNVTKTFGTKKALDDATLTVPTGAIYGLVGPNGAGKSTLIRHLTGIYRPDSGTITVDGKAVFDNTEIKQRMFCIYDDIYYYMHATVKDMKKLYSKLYPTFSDESFHALQDAFPELNEKMALRSMSKGMLKQAAFWLGLSCQPEILILDEPVDGLDPVMRRQVWSILMDRVAQQNTTVLLSSHNLRELEDVCDHVGVMHQGKVLLERNLGELQASTAKIQMLFPGDMPVLPEDLTVLHHSTTGRMHSFILRGSPETLTERLSALNPQYLEALPLTLEEIFIYELGGVSYAAKEILL